MTIKYVKKNFFGKEKYISEFTRYQKLHFHTPVSSQGGIIWRTIIRKNIPRVYFCG